jgi:hypothetical protein
MMHQCEFLRGDGISEDLNKKEHRVAELEEIKIQLLHAIGAQMHEDLKKLETEIGQLELLMEQHAVLRTPSQLEEIKQKKEKAVRLQQTIEHLPH